MRYLKMALPVIGVVCIFGIWPLSVFWPSGWNWHGEGRSEYLEMILGIYATLGVFLVIAAFNPVAHISLIWFTIWSSIVHGSIMTVQAVVEPRHIGHLWGDVPVLFAVAIVLAILVPRRKPG
jgi:hypothetical protein